MSDLSFEKADYGGTGTPPCAHCGKPRGVGYYQLGQLSFCAVCQAGTQAYWAQPVTTSGYLRGLGAGVGAGLAGAIAWAAVSVFLHMQLGIVAIGVGMFVAWAIRKGAGRGGRELQVMAVLITYLTIVEATVAGELLESGGTSAEWQRYLLMAPRIVPYTVAQEGLGGVLWFVILAIALNAAWRPLSHRPLPWVGPLT